MTGVGDEQYVYVYAAVAGRPGDGAVSQLLALPEGAAPRILPLDRDVSVVVADVPSSAYKAESLELRLADLDWVSRCGASHHAVSDALFESHVVVPFRLFTLFSSEGKALKTLRESAVRIGKSLARVKGRQEWVLRIGRPDPSRIGPAGTSGTVATATSSGTSFLRGKADARREEAERVARVSTDAAAVFDRLRTIADDATARPLDSPGTLLLDAAFLVGTDRAGEFQKALTDSAAGLLRDGCPVSLTGPWPPYSFASFD